jgi:hypothetical protein
MKTLLAAAIFGVSLFGVNPQEKPAANGQSGPAERSSCPMHKQDQSAAQTERQKGVPERGDQGMGFSQEKTTHHFRLYKDGGAIEVEANDAQDTANRDAIRAHFAHIVKMFEAGDFSIPLLIHAENPPGAETMKRLREVIQYKLENTDRGGRIRITSKNAEAVEAVHAFLRFQITDHKTGDSHEDTSAPIDRICGSGAKSQATGEWANSQSTTAISRTLPWLA